MSSLLQEFFSTCSAYLAKENCYWNQSIFEFIFILKLWILNFIYSSKFEIIEINSQTNFIIWSLNLNFMREKKLTFSKNCKRKLEMSFLVGLIEQRTTGKTQTKMHCTYISNSHKCPWKYFTFHMKCRWRNGVPHTLNGCMYGRPPMQHCIHSTCTQSISSETF